MPIDLSFDENGNTQLHLAASDGDADRVRHLLDEGWPVDVPTRDGATPLMQAVYQLECCRLLLAASADVNARDHYGNTPLHSAALAGQLATSRLFLDHGADIEAMNGMDKKPSETANIFDHSMLSDFIVAYGAARKALDCIDATDHSALSVKALPA